MLKIKDNVDLKELEKQGWKFNGQSCYILHSKNNKFHISINKATRFIQVFSMYWEYEFEQLYDLIQDGLVEKVGDEINNE